MINRIMHRGAITAPTRTNQNHHQQLHHHHHHHHQHNHQQQQQHAHHQSAPTLTSADSACTSPASLPAGFPDPPANLRHAPMPSQSGGFPVPPPPCSTSDGSSGLSLRHLELAVTCLWGLTPTLASLSLAIVTVAVATNQWLHTDERMRNPAYNGTGERDYLSKLTVSGLWTLCYTNPGEKDYHCSNIDYFSKEEYSPDPNDSTLAIPYAVTRSTVFFLVATLLLCAGYCSCLIGHCTRQRRLFTFVSGVIFIVSGLVMLFGLIMYISVFKAEVGSKLRARSQLAPPAFTYRYGYSFLLYVSGFVSVELAGTCAIFLFIYAHQSDWLRHARLKRKAPPSSSSYTHLDHVAMLYAPPCRRHPHAYINTNSAIQFPIQYPSPIQQRRYFFNKEPISESPCSIHRVPSRNALSNSLKDVSTYYDFPPPPTISYQFEDWQQHQRRSDISTLTHFPRDVTSNTVSTTADVNTCDEMGNITTPSTDRVDGHHFDDYSPSIQHEHEFVTFNLDEPLAIQMRTSSHAPPTISISGGALAANSESTATRPSIRSEFSIDSLRRTTPV